MSTIHIVSSGKGSSGKSVFASVLADLLEGYGHPVTRIDADPQKQDMRRLYPNKEVEGIVLGYDPDLEDMPMLILSAATDQACEVVVDLAAETDIHLNRWIETIALEEIAPQQGIKLMKWWVADGSTPSLQEFCNSVKAFPGISHVLVKNHAKTRPNRWPRAIASVADVEKLLKENASTITLPKLFGNLADEFRQSGVTWEAVMKAYAKKDWKQVTLATASIANKWLKTVSGNIEAVYPMKRKTKKEAA
ncbi:MAG: hypothetical protein AAF810_08730 [Cyanobacteria bacterium P01_D01_bin.36]